MKPKAAAKSVLKSKENIEPTKAAAKPASKKIDDMFKKTAKKKKVSSDEEDDVISASSDSDFEVKPKKKLMNKQNTFDMFKKVSAGPKSRKKIVSSDEEFIID